MTDVAATLHNRVFKGWESIGRVGVRAYAGLLFSLRIENKCPRWRFDLNKTDTTATSPQNVQPFVTDGNQL